jgi:hypothetical protein
MLNPLSAEGFVNNLKHEQDHIEKLSKLYPDLTVANIDGANLKYFSNLANTSANTYVFNAKPMNSYCMCWEIIPYKKVSIQCSQCSGDENVGCKPYSIGFAIEHEIAFRSKYAWYSLTYDEVVKKYNFSPQVLVSIQKHLLFKIEEYKKEKREIDLFHMNDGVKKLLPFT